MSLACHVHRLEELHRAACAHPGARAGEGHGHHHVLFGGQVRQEVACRLLPDKSHNGTPIGETVGMRHTEQIPVSDASSARRWYVEPRQHIEQR